MNTEIIMPMFYLMCLTVAVFLFSTSIWHKIGAISSNKYNFFRRNQILPEENLARSLPKHFNLIRFHKTNSSLDILINYWKGTPI